MKTSFKNKYGNWALITGATSGIGAELTSQIAAKGLNIILVARKAKELEEYALSLKERYAIETKVISADLATEEGIEKVKQVNEKIGLLVLAAGLEVNGAFEKNSIEKELKVIYLNVVTTLHLTHHFSKEMVLRKKGGILFVASLSGHMPNPYFSNYAGTKSYVLNFGASLFGELKPKGVDVSILSPGLTNTPMVKDNGMDWNKTPMKAMDPSVVAEVGLNGLGKHLLSIPGGKNKIMAWMAKHMPLQMQTKMNEKMIRKAIDKTKI
ncbi:MAG: SDR family NAD(P)-dependent oxidoreductase [Flavobacteriales bacterium]|nr:SDR family NAD(P)-dependent oxidoreductase [Flavobacteriales bacterium]